MDIKTLNRGISVMKLLKTFFFLALFIYSAQQSQAVEWGLKFGLNSTSFALSSETLQKNHTAHTDYILGAFLTFHISEKWAIQPEVYFSEEGAEYDWLMYSFDFYNYKYRMPYFQFPVLLKFNIPVEGRFLPSLFFGPYAKIRQEATFLRVIDHGEAEDFGQREDITDVIKSFDYGLVIGGGLGVKTCFGKIVLDIRYSFGLTNMATDIKAISDLIAEDAIFRNETLANNYGLLDFIKSRSFVLMIGLGF